MAFAQLTYRESLRDIEACLRAQPNKLYHLGIRGQVSRSTLAHANSVRDWRIYADFAQVLIKRARALYLNDHFAAELDQTVYALDATTIDLCLDLFPWAEFRKAKGAVKLHTLLDLRGNIPTVVIITHGKVHEVKILDQLRFEAGAFYVMDRAYLDFARLHKLHRAAAFFVTRAKKRFDFQWRDARPVDRTTGVLCDQVVTLVNPVPRRGYPESLRRIRYKDAQTKQRLVFLTNNFNLPPLTIAALYRSRWQVELFFKWIKQHLRIQKFYGTSANAVKTQIWIALSIYVLVAIVKKELHLDASLYRMLQICSVAIFEKTPLLQALSLADGPSDLVHPRKQLILFD
jgi:transposase